MTNPPGQSLQSTFRWGWVFGSEGFRERLLGLLGREGEDLGEERRKGYHQAQKRDHGIAEAELIVQTAQQILGLGTTIGRRWPWGTGARASWPD